MPVEINAVTILGNLAADPEVRILPDGRTMCKMRVGVNDRWFDRDKGEWQQRETVWMRIVMWRDLAANVGASLRRGDRVMVVGKLRQHSFTPTEGEKRITIEVEAQTVALDLSRAVATVMKVRREGHASSEVEPREFESEPVELTDALVHDEFDDSLAESADDSLDASDLAELSRT